MKTQTIRIAVAIDGDGRWNACGWDIGPDAQDDFEIGAQAVDGLNSDHHLQGLTWVEAEIPVPEETTVTAPGRLDDDVDKLLNHAANYGDFQRRVGNRPESEFYGEDMDRAIERAALWRPIVDLAARINARLAHRLEPVEEEP